MGDAAVIILVGTESHADTGRIVDGLEADTEYVLVWENADGLQHNFAIEDENGEDLQASELVREEGATQTVTFTATEEMAAYYCQVHPQSMRGDIEIA